MPLEIKELQIKVTVNQPEGQGTTQNTTSPNAPQNKNDNEAIINQCIEQVMEIINTKKER